MMAWIVDGMLSKLQMDWKPDIFFWSPETKLIGLKIPYALCSLPSALHYRVTAIGARCGTYPCKEPGEPGSNLLDTT